MRSSFFAMPAVRPSVLGFMTALMLAGVPAFMLSGAAAERPFIPPDERRGGERLLAADRADTPAELKLAGGWEVLVLLKKPHPLAATVHVAPPEIVSVVAEKYDSLPQFNPNAGGWGKGAQLRGVCAQETTTPDLVHVAPPEIVSVVAEKYDSLPQFNPNAGGWGKGAQLRGVCAQETTTPD